MIYFILKNFKGKTNFLNINSKTETNDKNLLPKSVSSTEQLCSPSMIVLETGVEERANDFFHHVSTFLNIIRDF